MSWCFRWLVGCGREPAHRGVLGRADIPDIDFPSILALLDSRPLRTSRGYGINHLAVAPCDGLRQLQLVHPGTALDAGPPRPLVELVPGMAAHVHAAGRGLWMVARGRAALGVLVV